MKYFGNESYIFSIFALQGRHKFVLILVNWLTENGLTENRLTTYLKTSAKLLYFENQIATFVGI